MFDLRLNKEIQFRGHLFRVLEATVEFIIGGSAILAAREAAGANMDNDPEVLRVSIDSALAHTEYREDDVWRALTPDEGRNMPVGLMREIQEAFMELQDGLTVPKVELQQNAAAMLLKRSDAPPEARSWLETMLPNEAEQAPKAIAPEPSIGGSGT